MDVFENEGKMIAHLVKEEMKGFIAMLDCMDDPVGLEYTSTNSGVKLTITVEHIDD